MRAVLIVSRLTFVPQNYHGFIMPLIRDPRIVGVMVLDNLSWDFKLKACVLVLTGLASRLGLQLIRNMNLRYLHEKESLCAELKKSFLLTRNPHDPQAIEWLREADVDYLVNARTRTIFRKSLLAIPKKGSLNIHHGLLPDQRGLMCDFWGLYNNEPSGFSVHEMTSQLDAGKIFLTETTPAHPEGYLAQTAESAGREAQAISRVLSQLEEGYAGIENARSPQTKYHRNPGLKELLAFRLRGKRF